jgi:biopolymer transport protein TolR
VPKVIPSASASGAGRGSRGRRVSSTLAEINIIPLVDVMLVLLIIFMVTAPMLQKGVEVKLPVASRTQDIASERLFVDVPISFRSDHTVFIAKEPIRLEVLGERMRQMLLTKSDKQVFLRSDGKLTVQEWMDVQQQLKAAGVTNIGVVTASPGEQR